MVGLWVDGSDADGQSPDTKTEPVLDPDGARGRGPHPHARGRTSAPGTVAHQTGQGEGGESRENGCQRHGQAYGEKGGEKVGEEISEEVGRARRQEEGGEEERETFRGSVGEAVVQALGVPDSEERRQTFRVREARSQRPR